MAADADAGTGGALAPIDAGTLISATDAGGNPLSVPVPFQNKIILVERTRVAGTMHVHGIDRILEGLDVGSKLRLEREPGNVSDVWAIKVLAGHTRIGYVSADCNEILARLMDGGKSLSGKLVGKERAGTWNKLCLEVVLDD